MIQTFSKIHPKKNHHWKSVRRSFKIKRIDKQPSGISSIFFCIEDDFTLNIHGNFQWCFRSYRIYEVLTIASLNPRQCFGTSTAKKEHSTWILSSTRFAFKSWNWNCYDCLSNSCGLHFLGAIIFSENSSMYAAFLKQSGMASMKRVFLGLGCWEDMARISFAWLVIHIHMQTQV